MKIGFVVRPTQEVSLTSASGISVFSYYFIKELAKHDEIESIDVYGVGQDHFNEKKVNFVNLLPFSIEEFIKENVLFDKLQNYSGVDLKNAVIDNLNIKISKLMAGKDYDIIHDNSTYPIYGAFSSFFKTPVLTTIHTPIDSESILIPSAVGVFNKFNNHYFACISDYQRQVAKERSLEINIIDMIHNGIDIRNVASSSEASRSNCLWIGRITQTDNKGVKEALQVVNKLGIKLNLISRVIDDSFFENAIKPLITQNVTMITNDMDLNTKLGYYRNSAFLLYPLMWDEPFGLIFVEAMASGTPVVAYARGSVPEIIKDGETGFIVNSTDDDIRGDFIIKKTGIEGLCEAVQRIYAMPDEEYQQMRRDCRDCVEKNFTVEKMVDKYIDVYKQIISKK